jgi:hypothetical protein
MNHNQCDSCNSCNGTAPLHHPPPLKYESRSTLTGSYPNRFTLTGALYNRLGIRPVHINRFCLTGSVKLIGSRRRNADRHGRRVKETFEKGDLVLLSSKNLPLVTMQLHMPHVSPNYTRGSMNLSPWSLRLELERTALPCRLTSLSCTLSFMLDF